MKFENTEVWGIEHALRGMRNPMNSWSKSDSKWIGNEYVVGDEDMGLAKRLIKAGDEHSKFMRMVHVGVDVTAPVYMLSEIDTYKIGVTRNSTSFMHKGTTKSFSIRDFEVDEKVYEVLDPIPKESAKHELIYPFDTNEYKIYSVGDRDYKVYKNGKIVACQFTVTDTTGHYERTKTFPERELKPTQYSKSKYWYLNLGGRRHYKRMMLHRIVAEAWLPHDDGLEVNHKNGNKGDNSVENLEWVTRSENEKHKYDIGLYAPSLKTKYKAFKDSTKLSLGDKMDMINLLEEGASYSEIADIFDISYSYVWNIKNEAYDNVEQHHLFEYCYYWEKTIEKLNALRDEYLLTKDPEIFRAIRALLPMSYMYTSTFDLNYSVIRRMYFQRRHHRLPEWSVDFVNWVKTLPLAEELIMYE